MGMEAYASSSRKRTQTYKARLRYERTELILNIQQTVEEAMQKALQLTLQQHNQQGVSDRVVTLSWAETGWGGVRKEDWCRGRCHSKKGFRVGQW